MRIFLSRKPFFCWSLLARPLSPDYDRLKEAAIILVDAGGGKPPLIVQILRKELSEQDCIDVHSIGARFRRAGRNKLGGQKGLSPALSLPDALALGRELFTGVMKRSTESTERKLSLGRRHSCIERLWDVSSHQIVPNQWPAVLRPRRIFGRWFQRCIGAAHIGASRIYRRRRHRPNFMFVVVALSSAPPRPEFFDVGDIDKNPVPL